ncbi:hypothetical protein TNCV_3002991 [Trichonephila clavipes]|nr:hypothetical protein TNCV_3002991 [Trichonephila clavipes]
MGREESSISLYSANPFVRLARCQREKVLFNEFLGSLDYADKPQRLDHLEDNIRRVIADIRPQMLEKVIENWTSRLDYIRASRGSSMPEIIFKIRIISTHMLQRLFETSVHPDTCNFFLVPAYLPDVSPIQHVWDLVSRCLAREMRPAASKDEHLRHIQAIWNSLP